VEIFLFNRTSFDHMFDISLQKFFISENNIICREVIENNIIFFRSHFEYCSNFFIKKMLKSRSEVELIKQEEPTNIGGVGDPLVRSFNLTCERKV
jgi:hypothetical protein